MFSCRTLTHSAMVSCRTLQIAEPKALNLEKDDLAEPGMGGSNRGGIPDLDLSFLLSFFFGTPPIFRDIPGLSGFFLGWSFPFSWPIRSTCKKHSRKGPRHNQDLSRKRWKRPPQFGTHPTKLPRQTQEMITSYDVSSH